MKFYALFSKKNNFFVECCLLQILLGALRVNLLLSTYFINLMTLNILGCIFLKTVTLFANTEDK